MEDQKLAPKLEARLVQKLKKVAQNPQVNLWIQFREKHILRNNKWMRSDVDK